MVFEIVEKDNISFPLMTNFRNFYIRKYRNMATFAKEHNTVRKTILKVVLRIVRPWVRENFSKVSAVKNSRLYVKLTQLNSVLHLIILGCVGSNILGTCRPKGHYSRTLTRSGGCLRVSYVLCQYKSYDDLIPHPRSHKTCPKII
jgi:hypothetical protein